MFNEKVNTYTSSYLYATGHSSSFRSCGNQIEWEWGSKPSGLPIYFGGQCKIVNNGNGTINMSGSTSTYTAVQQVGLKLNLQYLSGGQWVTLKTYSYTNYSSTNVSEGKLLCVSSGYNYRVFAQHTCINGSVSESGQSYSEAIYIQ